MKLQNSFRDYTAESSLFVRRALVPLFGDFAAYRRSDHNLATILQIVRFDDYQTRSNENRIKLVLRSAEPLAWPHDRNGTPLALNRTIYQLE